jgi:hypothetical protein
MLVLAISSELFQPIWIEDKKAIWINSAIVEKNILLDLIEYQHKNHKLYTGRYIRIKITHIDSQNSMPNNYCICSFLPQLYGVADSAKASESDKEMFS